MSPARLLLLALAVASPLAACGKKGDPYLPPGVEDERQISYPDPDEARLPSAPAAEAPGG